ncbi:MAG: hypothetical protein JRJ03_16580 [Deltaproteobacteria bacterium]|nr:hypothetical protein [Deltaproteobacteria bacterium]
MTNERHPDVTCEDICSEREVPDDNELEALNAMRRIKDRVRMIRKRIDEVHSSEGNGSAEVETLQEELKRLKDDWSRWEKRREEAARERMIKLGHDT